MVAAKTALTGSHSPSGGRLRCAKDETYSAAMAPTFKGV
jgi:hypothetical protein